MAGVPRPGIPSTELTAAVRAVSDAPLSASGRYAVYGACLRTVLGLSQIDRRMGTATIGSRVDSAAKALAVGDALSTQQLRVIFAPFIAAGFRSLPVAAAPTEQ